MSIPASLFARLADSAVVSGLCGGRIYPVFAPAGSESSGPFVVYSLADSARDSHTKGSSGLVTYSYKVEAVADSYELATSLAGAVLDVVESWRDKSGDSDIRFISVSGEEDDFDRLGDGSDKALYIRRMTLGVTVRERRTAIPSGSAE